MARLLLSALLIATLLGCSKKETEPEKGTVEYFKSNLKADMDFAAIKATFGEPNGDIGSGIHIYVYPLKDATAVWIGYAGKILYARHMDANGQLIAVLL